MYLIPVFLHEGAQAGGIFQLIRLLEGKRNDLEPLLVVLVIEPGEERRFVMAVRAPAARDVDQDNLPAKAGVRIGNDVPSQVGKTEVERLRRIFHRRVRFRIGRLGQTFGQRLFRTHGFHFVEAVKGAQTHVERAVSGRFEN